MKRVCGFGWFREDGILLRLSASHARRTRERGFTLIELVVVLAILGILLALAVPRYIGFRKRAFKEEIANILQEVKTLSWAYYQEYDTFAPITTATVIGFVMPGNSRWALPVPATSATVITWTSFGSVLPLVAADNCHVSLYGDGGSNQGCSF